MTAAPPRVRWRERQTVRAADLAAEQAHRLDARRRHLRGHHRPGVAGGLELAAAAGGVTVAPGVAVDGLGRSIAVGHELTLDGATLDGAFDRLGEDELVLAVRYAGAAAERVSGRHGRERCRPEDAGRWVEECRLVLATAAAFDSRPPHEPAGDDGGEGGDGGGAVPLGTVVRDDGGFTVRPEPRAHAGLVAQTVRDPAGRARLAFPAEPDRRRFTVAVGDGAAPPAERLAVERDVTVRVTGAAVAGGRVELVEKGPRPSQRARFGVLAATPAEARPWSVYRTDFQPLDAAGQPAGPVRRQLRVEIGPPGEDGDPAATLFAVGRRVGGRFVPCLRVDADCTLTVRGLAVEGQVVEAPIPADPGDPRFGAAAGEAMLRGINATLGQNSAVAVETDVSRTSIFDGEDVEFTVNVRNPGPARLQAVQVFGRLQPASGSAPNLLLATVPFLDPGAEDMVSGSFESPAVGDYTLAISAVATGPGATPVAAAGTTAITVSPVIG